MCLFVVRFYSLFQLRNFSCVSPPTVLVCAGQKFVRTMIALPSLWSLLPVQLSPTSLLSSSAATPIASLILSCVFAAASVCERAASVGHVIIQHAELCCSIMEVCVV